MMQMRILPSQYNSLYIMVYMRYLQIESWAPFTADAHMAGSHGLVHKR